MGLSINNYLVETLSDHQRRRSKQWSHGQAWLFYKANIQYIKQRRQKVGNSRPIHFIAVGYQLISDEQHENTCHRRDSIHMEQGA